MNYGFKFFPEMGDGFKFRIGKMPESRDVAERRNKAFVSKKMRGRSPRKRK